MIRRALLTALTLAPLQAWSPDFHEAQTRMALTQVPRPLKAFLESHREVLVRASRGLANDRVPLPEEVHEQYRLVVQFSEERKSPEVIVRELVHLGRMVQLMTDPSALQGATSLRAHFEAYADSEFPQLVLTREPYWGHQGSPDVAARIQDYARLKADRYRRLEPTFDHATGRRASTWDRLSPAFGVLQAAYSQGVHATANLWILAYRQCGEAWGL